MEDLVRQGRQSLDPGHRILGIFLSTQGEVMRSLHHYKEAVESLLEAHTVLSAASGVDPRRVPHLVEQLILTFEAWHEVDPVGGHDSEAEKWHMELKSLQEGHAG